MADIADPVLLLQEAVELLELTGQRWQLIPGTWLYAISDTGHVLNVRRHRLLHPVTTPKGLWIRLRVEGTWRGLLVHRLVAASFIDNPAQHPVVRHHNGLRTDNRATNLTWQTH